MGIDYGNGTTNIDHAAGIRYGVIPANSVAYWYESSEPNYGEPHCPKCGNPVETFNDETHSEFESLNSHSCADYACESCGVYLDSSDAYGEEPLSWSINDGEIIATQAGDDHDIFVIKSPFYTFAPFCSPCAPGACYLLNGSTESDAKAYCFPVDWFDDSIEPCPYPVYRVDTDECVYNPVTDCEVSE